VPGPGPTDDLAVAAVLSDGLRGRLYRFVRGRHPRPVTRDEAAAAAGISRGLAAFHLDKLVAGGLLRARHQRPAGQRRAGRAPKVYEPSDLEVEITIPPRHYDLAGGLLVEAVTRHEPGEPASAAALRLAREHGAELGARFRATRRLGRPGPERTLTAALEVLEGLGYEPRRDGPRAVTLANCPFHALARRSPELICGMNRALVDGLLRGLGNEGVEAVLAPREGACCVELRPPEARSTGHP
jgi:predicted ArsR family transcriptional regulator